MAALDVLILGEQRAHDDDFCHGDYNRQPKGPEITQLNGFRLREPSSCG
jgi:hypothetical protein